MKVRLTVLGFAALCTAILALGTPARAQQDSALLDALVKKGVLSDQEAEDIRASEEKEYSSTAASKINLGPSIKSITFYGDLRLRYELRDGTTGYGALNGAGAVFGHDDSQTRNRWRYRLRFGVKGDLYDQFFYGLRVATNPNYDRSGNVSFGDSDSAGPFGKAKSLLAIDQVYLGWKPTDYLTLTGGQMPNPLYTTSMIWSDDLNPTGAAEQFDKTFGDAEVFATAGQFIYGTSNDNEAFTAVPAGGGNYSEIFMFAEQVGFKYKFDENTFFKGAGTIYTYSGTKNGNNATVGGLYSANPLAYNVASGNSNSVYGTDPSAFDGPFVGAGPAPATNSTGVNNLAVVEFPMEFDFRIGPGVHETTTTSGDPKDMKDVTSTTSTTGWSLPMRIFADFAYNLEADQRADEARNAVNAFDANAVVPGSTAYNNAGITNTGTTAGNTALYNSPDVQGILGDGKSFLDQAAYQVGVEAGQLKKKGDWDAKLYWQSTGYYAVDPNLVDADIFNAATNLQGAVVSVSHNWTEGLSSTLRYAYATKVDNHLATPNVEQDLQIGDIHQYNLFQADLMWKF
jgi:hypothetical protein